jgi:uncharacterized protein YegP (UPF0339 family)
MRPLAKAIVLPLLLALTLSVGGLPVAPGQDKKKDDKAGAVIFELYKDKQDEFRFRLKEGDHLLAISGKGYKTREDIQKVIDEIRKDAAKAKLVDETTKK